MDDRQVLSVREAANALGVSSQRVRQMIGSGQLVARRSSGGWLVPEREVAARGENIGRGRPVEARTAWAVIRLLAARSVDEAVEGLANAAPLRAAVEDRRLRHRALRLLAALPDPVEDPAPWRRLLSSRGRARRLWAHPGVLGRLAADPVVARGRSAAASVAGDGLTGGHAYPGLYVAADDIDGLIRRYRLRDDPDGQVLLVVVPPSVPEDLAPAPGVNVPAPAAIADLLDEDDPRARDLAAHQLRDRYAALRSATNPYGAVYT